ncbi:ATP-binding protein, partial [Kitasatospora sp. A2-31]|uniref:ATP-binding protein n=1 Tax=Kitasatospora sp. A2-31 TaxID=2916414 RepID=UPI001EEECBD0|nr:ATP-binding protein [Kitasatospora sp. A2-31]
AAWPARPADERGRLPVSIVSGAPGLGKTALAVHTAARLTDRFRDGCLFVDLRGLDTEPVTPHDALARLLRALGVRERDVPVETDERQVLYRRMMRERNALVVLDNAAHEAQVRALLPAAGAGAAWITSRRTLTGIEHARRLLLEPLPADAATALLGTILAQQDDARWGGTPGDGTTGAGTTGDDTSPDTGAARPDPAALALIADLCGHLPLALRIAGHRLLSRPGWSAHHLAERLGDEDLRLQRLAAGDLRIRSAFGLSYAQLPEPLRRLFRRLALVPGPDFDAGLGAALTGLGLGRVEEMLDELLELGLLGQTSADRLLFHDLIRLYARERLQEEESSEERRSAETALYGWLLDTASSAGQWFQPDPPPAGAAPFATALAAQRWLQT